MIAHFERGDIFTFSVYCIQRQDYHQEIVRDVHVAPWIQHQVGVYLFLPSEVGILSFLLMPGGCYTLVLFVPSLFHI